MCLLPSWTNFFFFFFCCVLFFVCLQIYLEAAIHKNGLICLGNPQATVVLKHLHTLNSEALTQLVTKHEKVRDKCLGDLKTCLCSISWFLSETLTSQPSLSHYYNVLWTFDPHASLVPHSSICLTDSAHIGPKQAISCWCQPLLSSVKVGRPCMAKPSSAVTQIKPAGQTGN